jgi:hypothetical protein
VNVKRLGGVLALVASIAGIGSFLLEFLSKKEASTSGLSQVNSGTQVTTGNNSPSVANIQGNVTINVDKARQVATIPELSMDAKSPEDIERIETFLRQHLGKLVHLNISVLTERSSMTLKSDQKLKIDDPEPTVETLALSPLVEADLDVCHKENFFSGCVSSYLSVTGIDYVLRYDNAGTHQLIGYFFLDDRVERHQGEVYGLRGVSKEKILLPR